LPGTAFPPDANGWQLWWRRHLEGVKPSLASVFDSYMATFREAEAESKRFSKWGSDFKSMSPEERFAREYDPFVGLANIDALKGTLKAVAASLLLPLDNLLGDLRFRLSGSERCRDDGPQLLHGVTVDRALDAFGNYFRHEHEWRNLDVSNNLPNKEQLRSMLPIARLSTTMPIGDDEAAEAYIQYTLTSPAILILDLLCDFKKYGPDTSYDVVEQKIFHAGVATIARVFAPSTGQSDLPVVE
jgi:hypothetical protein